MRVLIVPLIAIAVVFGGANDEPTEHQMRGAFEVSLAAKVRGALEFVAEIGGATAVDEVRHNGNDRFNIRDFQKRECARADGSGHFCAFTVHIEVANGGLQSTMRGRFHGAPDGLIYTPET
jgi:hypothetical protein